MKLSTKSWHYRFYTWYNEKTPPNNLCLYFWRLILHLCFLTVIGGIVGAMLIGMVGMFWHMGDKKEHWMFSTGLTGWIITGVLLVIFGVVWLFEKDHLIGSFFRAKIGKYCPKIDWEEYNHED